MNFEHGFYYQNPKKRKFLYATFVVYYTTFVVYYTTFVVIYHYICNILYYICSILYNICSFLRIPYTASGAATDVIASSKSSRTYSNISLSYRPILYGPMALNLPFASLLPMFVNIQSYTCHRPWGSKAFHQFIVLNIILRYILLILQIILLREIFYFSLGLLEIDHCDHLFRVCHHGIQTFPNITKNC